MKATRLNINKEMLQLDPEGNHAIVVHPSLPNGSRLFKRHEKTGVFFAYTPKGNFYLVIINN